MITIYKINPGTLSRINKFKELVGEDIFNKLLQGSGTIDIPFEESKFKELMECCLDEEPECKYEKIPYAAAEEIVSFFCKPFAGKLLRQMKYTMDGISSLLSAMDEKTLTIVAGFIHSRNQKPTSTGASSLPEETTSVENVSTTDAPPAGSPE